MKIVKKQINIEYREKKIFWLLFSLFVFFTISYGFLLNKTMMSAVSKQNIEKQITSLGSEVNSLEFDYLNLKNSITFELAMLKGFVPAPSDKFVVVDSVQKNISLSINEN